MKLHVGCGNKYFDGWTNLDIDSDSADICGDARELVEIDDNSCEIIYASHILEHFSRHEYESVLSIWHRKLTKGGTLRISVPDFEAVAKIYAETGDILPLVGLVSGGQRNQFDYHCMIFDEKMLTDCLLKIGFGKVRHWNWRDADHANVDDYSQAYIPHMDKENGTLMSLNIEAVK